MPVYCLPAADVESAVASAIASSDAVARAQRALDAYLDSPDGRQVAAGIADGTFASEAEARQFTLLGLFTSDRDQAVAAVRRRVEMAFTVITAREVTAGLRVMWPQCYLRARDAGENSIEVTMPASAAADLLVGGEGLLRSLLGQQVQVSGTREATRAGMPCAVLTLGFALAG